MLFNIIEKLPIDIVGYSTLSYLGLCDIVRLERACCSKTSHQLLLDLILYVPPVILSENKHSEIKALEWFASRRCKIGLLDIAIPGDNPCFHVENLQVDQLDINFNANTTMDYCKDLFESNLVHSVRRMTFYGSQVEGVMEQLSLFTGNIETIQLKMSYKCYLWLNKDILSRWKLKELNICSIELNGFWMSNLLQNCTELISIELSCNTVTDDVVMAITQHCPKLKNLTLDNIRITYKALLALSENSLSLEELNILSIPNIPTADIAKRCSHALSCIRHLSTYNLIDLDCNILIPYLTGLTSIDLDNRISQLYIPVLAQHCKKLKTLELYSDHCSIQDMLPLCHTNTISNLRLFDCLNVCVITDTVLIELIHACPHLRTLYLLNKFTITDISILALSENCPQLHWLEISRCHKVTEAAVLQLLQRCHNLTRLEISSSSLSEETWTQLDKNTQKRVSRC